MKLSKDYTPHLLGVFLVFTITFFAYFVEHNNFNDSKEKGKPTDPIQVYGDEKMGYVVSTGQKMLWSDEVQDTLKMKIAIQSLK